MHSHNQENNLYVFIEVVYIDLFYGMISFL